MHETLSQKFKGYIDTFKVKDDNFRLSGWLVTTEPREDVVYYVDIGYPLAFYNFNERPDVAAFYKADNQNFSQCGFDIAIPAVRMADRSEVSIYAIVHGQKETIFNLNLEQQREIQPEILESPIVDEVKDIRIRKNIVPEIIVVDNFYENPDDIREIALAQEFTPDLRYHKGKRTSKKFLASGTKQMFESLLGRRITNWAEHGYNGIFQYCTPEDALVYHSDVQSYAGAIYLTPNAPVETGTSFFRSKEYPDIRKTWYEKGNYEEIFKGGFYDKTKFELVDNVGNIYNRLVIWDSRLIHSASQYFGTDKYNSRLFHLFFFDIEE